MMDVLGRVKYLSGEEETVKTVATEEICGFKKYVISDLDWKNVEYIDFGYNLAVAEFGEEGYYIVPQITQRYESFICSFKEREDSEYEGSSKQGVFIPIFAVKRKDLSFAAIITDMEYACKMTLKVEDGKYYLYPRICLDGEAPCGEVSVLYRELAFDETNYSLLGNLYRNYLLDSGICKPLSQRHTEALDYGKESLYVRIRQAWKPVPSPVEEQTDENEPPIHVACDYAAVRRLMDRCKSEGVDKADFCLVGWNKSGHDGRWPQIFPTEPLLGTEDELRELIAHAKELGYTMSCHTNSTEAYSIANCYNEDDLVVDKDGSFTGQRVWWGGGRSRNVCAKCAYEFAVKELPKVRDLGFNGIHYIDVVSITQPEHCYNEKHPLTIPEGQEYRRKMGELCRELFGGFASEGARGYCMPALDYGLYVSFHNPFKEDNDFADEYVPLWEIVYHGISLYNCCTATVNPTIKSARDQLLAFERGARPSFYYYSKFMSDPAKDWMGEVDMRCGTEEELTESVARLKEAHDDYENVSYLQDCFMVGHSMCDGVATVDYSDGSRMIVDYNEQKVELYRDGKLVWQKNNFRE